MRLVTCAGYYGTGSSAITDIINECDNVHFMGDYEFRFIQDPDGVCDLEYNLVINNHRHNSGYAIKRYMSNVHFLNGNKFIKKYNKFFDDKWIEYSAEYLHSLIDVSYKGYWHQDLRDKGKLAYVIERTYNKIMHALPFADKERNYTLFMKNCINYASYPGGKFYQLTRDYIDKLFEYANFDGKDIVMADQLVPPSNTSHYLKFFNDIRVVCVDRDPRDLYILERKYWNGTIIPHDVEKYCIWYKTTRCHKQSEKDTDRILRIQFEDLVYDYDRFITRVLEFCGISEEHHINPRKFFNPDISKNNTLLYKKDLEYANEISYIETHLEDYLYNYN